MAEETKRFYVYRLASESGATLYVGKGSGRRLKSQIARTGFYGEIISRHATDAAAYKAEVAAIARLNPPLNQNAGGGGPFVIRKIERRPLWLRRIEQIGTRVYAARELLKLDLRGHVSEDQIDAIKRVAAIA